MAYGKPEKLCPHEHCRKYRKYLKRAAHKFHRLQWKRNQENAATRLRHYGWSI